MAYRFFNKKVNCIDKRNEISTTSVSDNKYNFTNNKYSRESIFFCNLTSRRLEKLFFILFGFILHGFILTFVFQSNNNIDNKIYNDKIKVIESHQQIITDEKNTIIAFENSVRKHKLAIVVPFRDRFDELITFVPHISKFLRAKSIDFNIYIVNQIDEFRFNRASLINLGFIVSLEDNCDYMAMHDVDLLPLNDILDYSYPSYGPFHVSASGLHPDYNYKTFIGGILIISKQDFLKVNGMSNNYWGWGKEDDEFYLRLVNANLTVNRPNADQFITGRHNTFVHNHREKRRPRDKKRYLKQRLSSLKNDFSGLDSIQYKLREKIILKFDEFYEFKLINVELRCDKSITHWCEKSFQFLRG